MDIDEAEELFKRETGELALPMISGDQVLVWSDGGTWKRCACYSSVRLVAELWVEDQWADMDYPRSVDVRVLTPEGSLSRFWVRVEHDPTFTAELINKD